MGSKASRKKLRNREWIVVSPTSSQLKEYAKPTKEQIVEQAFDN
jgi:hypothetical protein